jgi:hypothetical protein
MVLRVLGLLVLVCLCGCATPPAGAPTDLGDGFRRENHPAFTAKEQAIATAARRCVEQRCGKKIDAYYRVRHTESGYSVLVFEVGRYVGKEPRFPQNRDWAVQLKEDGTVTDVFQGLE